MQEPPKQVMFILELCGHPEGVHVCWTAEETTFLLCASFPLVIEPRGVSN